MPPKIGANVRLGGKTRTLRYTWGALRKVQMELDGESLVQTMGEVARVSVRHITTMVWAGLLHDAPDLTIDDAEGMIEPPVQRLAKAISDAVEPWVTEPSEAVGEDEDEVKKKGSKS